MTLEEQLSELAAQAGDVELTDEHEYSRSGAVFAVIPSPAVVELRLGPEIAEAAARTPDTRISQRGDAWVRFTPRTLDDMAADRLKAWFLVAWRQAGTR
jgi:hypothetical protein